MNQQLLIGYDPKCELYSRTKTNGEQAWYIKYYLPSGERIRRSCGTTSKKAAQKMLRVKQLALLQGIFEESDEQRMPLGQYSLHKHTRLTIQDGIKTYLESTATLRTAKSQYNDTLALARLFGWLEQTGKVYMDEVKPFDIQQLLLQLYREGKAEATIKTYFRSLSKVFTWWIDEVEFLDMRHPAKKVTLPKRNGLVRERLITDTEFKSLLDVPYSVTSSHVVPIQEIVAFLGFTGCRVGECLHAEWSDFDLHNRIWHIRYKPSCPTLDGLGWMPKWKKPRSIRLFPEAVALLQAMPRYETHGAVHIRNAEGNIESTVLQPAQFIFPKRTVSIVNGYRQVRYTRISCLKRSWKTLKREANVYDVQLKDLRTYCNHVLRSRYGFSSKEAGAYLGNSEQVNNMHYSPVSQHEIAKKMDSFRLTEVLGINAFVPRS